MRSKSDKKEDFLTEPFPPLFVVIPTRNRGNLLDELLESIRAADAKALKLVLIVDSSDNPKFPKLGSFLPLHHITTSIASAAVQRNQAMEYLQNIGITKDSLICFLDDDVRIPRNYFNFATNAFRTTEDMIGFSGVSDEFISRPSSFFKRLFFLEGEAGGVTKGLINVPISKFGGSGMVETSWLIGCSFWKWSAISNLRFESDFTGQSLFEDVIFSFKAREKGKLFASSELVFKHLLSEIGRPNIKRHFEDLVRNRYRLLELYPSHFSKTAFWWTNLGMALGRLLRFLKSGNHEDLNAIKGIWNGSVWVIAGR
jgi:glycosyltransferase involved in cell wall biosynthesis